MRSVTGYAVTFVAGGAFIGVLGNYATRWSDRGLGWFGTQVRRRRHAQLAARGEAADRVRSSGTFDRSLLVTLGFVTAVIASAGLCMLFGLVLLAGAAATGEHVSETYAAIVGGGSLLIATAVLTFGFGLALERVRVLDLAVKRAAAEEPNTTPADEDS